jgi:polyisoprenoid-binding protein YceI
MIRTQGIYLRLHQLRFGLAISAFLIGLGAAAIAQERALQLDPAQTSVKFTLEDVLHTVHGTFQLKRGTLEFAPDAGKLSGEILVLVDAASGSSGSGMRDHKMNKEVLETSRYPEIVFHPDRIEGTVAAQGKSSVRVHGMFNIHGVDREITVPAEVEMSADHCNATVHFTVPYATWGMKNPSTLFLKVNDSVEIDLTAVGNVVTPSIPKTAQ